MLHFVTMTPYLLRITLSFLALIATNVGVSADDNTAGDMDLVRLPESTSPGGRCMDGSMAGYYIRDGEEDSNLFVIFVKGGGACTSKEACDSRSGTNLGSSNGWSNTTLGTRFLDADCDTNPSFCKATAVYIGYCTGDAHRGNVTNPTNASWGYYLDGHANFVAIIDKLVAEKGLGEPNAQVLLTGSSAGGIGVFYNIDWLSDRLPLATVKGVPVAGWFTPAALESDLPAPFNPSDYNHFANDENGNAMYDAYMNDTSVTDFDLFQMKNLLPAECLAARNDTMWFACASTHYAYPYIKSPLFHIHSQFDKYHIFSQGLAPEGLAAFTEVDTIEDYIEMWGEATRLSLQMIVNDEIEVVKTQPDGVFSASCLSHGTSESTLIDGKGFMDIVHDWFFQLGELEDYYRLVESCPVSDKSLPCNANTACQYDPVGKLPPMVKTCLAEMYKAGCTSFFGDNQQCLQCLYNNKDDIYAGGCNNRSVAMNICAYASRESNRKL